MFAFDGEEGGTVDVSAEEGGSTVEGVGVTGEGREGGVGEGDGEVEDAPAWKEEVEEEREQQVKC